MIETFRLIRGHEDAFHKKIPVNREFVVELLEGLEAWRDERSGVTSLVEGCSVMMDQVLSNKIEELKE